MTSMVVNTAFRRVGGFAKLCSFCWEWDCRWSDYLHEWAVMVMANFFLNMGLTFQRQDRKEVWLYDLFQALLHLTCTIG